MRRGLLVLALALAACGSGGDSSRPDDSGDTDALPGDEVPTSGVWELLATETGYGGLRLQGAAVHAGDLYIAAHDADRARFWRYGADGTRTELDPPNKVHNTSGARLVSAGDTLLALVPITLGGAQIDVYRVEGDALVAESPIAPGASTTARVAVCSAEGGGAVAYRDNTGNIVVQHWGQDSGWTTIGAPIPAATEEAWPGDLSLAWSEAGYLVGFGRNTGQQRYAYAWRSTASGWEQLVGDEAAAPGAVTEGSFPDVAWLGGTPHLLTSVPGYDLWRWQDGAWEVAAGASSDLERYDLRQSADGSALYWFARGGPESQARLERYVEDVQPLPTETTTGIPLEVGPFPLPPHREILSVEGALYWVYDDETGNVWKVHVARWVPG